MSELVFVQSIPRSTWGIISIQNIQTRVRSKETFVSVYGHWNWNSVRLQNYPFIQFCNLVFQMVCFSSNKRSFIIIFCPCAHLFSPVFLKLQFFGVTSFFSVFLAILKNRIGFELTFGRTIWSPSILSVSSIASIIKFLVSVNPSITFDAFFS